MYAIVRAGGRQEKVAVGDLVSVDRLAGEPGTTIQLPALLLVDGDAVTSDAATLAKVKVTAANRSRLVERPITWEDRVWLSWPAAASVILLS